MRKNNSIKAAAKLLMPLRRTCINTRNSTCSTAQLKDLDWTNWWLDNGYIHVRHSSGQTWHRVFPKKIRGRRCTRIAVSGGVPQWLYDSERSAPDSTPLQNHRNHHNTKKGETQ